MAMALCQAKGRKVKNYSLSEDKPSVELTLNEKQRQWKKFMSAFRKGYSEEEIIKKLKCDKAAFGTLKKTAFETGEITVEERRLAVQLRHEQKKEEEKEKAKTKRGPSEETLQCIVDAVANGASYNSVGKMFNMSHSAIRWHCEQRGVTTSHRSYNDSKKLSEDQISEIINKAWYGEPITRIANDFGVAPLAIEHHIKRSEIGTEFYPLSSLEKSVFSEIGEYSTSEIAERHNTTVNKVRLICSERGVSLRTNRNRLWTPLENEALIQEMQAAKKENRRFRINELSELTGRTPMAVEMHIQMLQSQYLFLK